MAELLLRATELQLRSDGDGRTVFGLVVPYNLEATVDDGAGPYREMFAPGAFARSIEQRRHKVKLNAQHDLRRFPIGRAVDLTDTPEGVRGAFYISATREGDDALTLLRDGTVDAFSVGFKPLRHRNVKGVIVRTEAVLGEVSLVGSPAYETALVSGVRDAGPPSLPVTTARARLVIALAKAGNP